MSGQAQMLYGLGQSAPILLNISDCDIRITVRNDVGPENPAASATGGRPSRARARNDPVRARPRPQGRAQRIAQPVLPLAHRKRLPPAPVERIEAAPRAVLQGAS